MHGIYLGANKGEASSQVLVENLGIRRFERHGISVEASREVTLSGNHISEATAIGPGGQGYGIAIEGLGDQHDPNAANDSRHNVVINNTFDGRHLRHAILLQFPTHNNLVADNTIVGSHLDAIDLHGEGEYLNEIRITQSSAGRGRESHWAIPADQRQARRLWTWKLGALQPPDWKPSGESSSSWELLTPSSRTTD